MDLNQVRSNDSPMVQNSSAAMCFGLENGQYLKDFYSSLPQFSKRVGPEAILVKGDADSN